MSLGETSEADERFFPMIVLTITLVQDASHTSVVYEESLDDESRQI